MSTEAVEEIEDEDWFDEDDEPIEDEEDEREPAEVLRRPLMSGWCAFPSVTDGVDSHTRCTGGTRANPAREFQPCPCPHHFDDAEKFECAGCGRVIAAAPHWPLDEDGDMRYTHIDPKDGRAIGEDCA